MSYPLIAGSSQIFVSAYADSDFFGRLILLSLGALSVICWVVLLQKLWQSRQVKILSQTFYRALEKEKRPLLSISIDSLPRSRSKEIPHPFADILGTVKRKTVEILEKNHFFLQQAHSGKEAPPVFLTREDLDLIEAEAATAIAKQTKQLEKNLFILSTIVTLAPFLGLLGTVWGILMTFSALHAGGSVGSNSVILGGLSTALATTVLGLVIAIPALVAYNSLRASLRNIQGDMEDFCYEIIGQIEMEYRRVAVE